MRLPLSLLFFLFFSSSGPFPPDIFLPLIGTLSQVEKNAARLPPPVPSLLPATRQSITLRPFRGWQLRVPGLTGHHQPHSVILSTSEEIQQGVELLSPRCCPADWQPAGLGGRVGRSSMQLIVCCWAGRAWWRHRDGPGAQGAKRQRML